MQYKHLVSVRIFILLALAVAVLFWFMRTPEANGPSIDVTNKVHSVIYQHAVAFFDAKLAATPFVVSPSTGIRLIWQKPEEIYNHFLITITDANSGWTRTESGEHERVSLDFTDLTADTLYTFVVQACIDPSCKSWMTSSEEIHATTTSNDSP